MPINSVAGPGPQIRNFVKETGSRLKVAMKKSGTRIKHAQKGASQKALKLRTEAQIKFGSVNRADALSQNIAAGSRAAGRIVSQISSSKVDPDRVIADMKKLAKLSKKEFLTVDFPVSSLKAALARKPVTEQQVVAFGDKLKEVQKQKFIGGLATNIAVGRLWDGGDEGMTELGRGSAQTPDEQFLSSAKAKDIETVVDWLKRAV